MGEVIKSYVSWRVVASAVCVILFTLAGSLWSTNTEKLRSLDARLDQKVDLKRYEADTQRIEGKIDMLINIHMAERAYKRIK